MRSVEHEDSSAEHGAHDPFRTYDFQSLLLSPFQRSHLVDCSLYVRLALLVHELCAFYEFLESLDLTWLW
jgi:hypothetical protein